MSSPSYTLHTPEGSFRAFKALIAAEYNGINVEVAAEFDPETVKSLSPTGKAPVLETPQGAIFESNAIARYLAKIRRDTGLTGDSVYDEAVIDSWVDFAANELELPATVWFYPALGYMPFNKEAHEKAKTDLAAGLTTLNNHLLTKTYLVGDQITLADITVASALLYPMKLVCDKAYLKPFGNAVRWFTTCVNQPEFKKVLGDVVMCKKETMAAGQAAPKAEASNKGGKKKDKKPAADAPPPAPKKVDHPYKIMDKEAPSKFIMDAWKKTYSNCESYDTAMATFWETFDKEGYSLWYQTYNFNEENTMAFKCCNAVGGFMQRSDEVRKWAFGAMHVIGTEDTVLEINGVWLLRGDTPDHLKQANDDANWYTWKKLAGKGLDPTAEAKQMVTDYWVNEETLEGKPIVDSKCFK